MKTSLGGFAAWLLLLLFSAWLFVLPGTRLPPVVAPTPAVSVSDGQVSLAVEHVAAESVMPHVLRAPLWARLPVPSFEPLREREPWLRIATQEPTDLRAALRRVQTRRRVPRLSTGEPPWS
jgi:hypothetical protein